MKYKDAGVDVNSLKGIKKRILHKIKAKGKGLFASGLSIGKDTYLFSSIDGVGTKTKIAVMMDRYDTLGYDIVNHCVNDLLSVGVEPLSFLDYIAFSKIKEENVEKIIEGVINACEEEGIELVGGETAQMPGVYMEGEFDLVGVINGVARKEELITGENIEKGDILWGLKSSGLHTNGYSLARKVLFEKKNFPLTYRINGETLGEILLKPHRSYLREFRKVRKFLKGIAHITGGGFKENIKRVLPEKRDFIINKKAWNVPEIFTLIQKEGEIPEEEMFNTFNMGIGMIFITSPHIDLRSYIDTFVIGEVI